MSKRINRRERTAILQSLGAGVVPGIGLQHVQVGRKDEVEAIVNDLKNVEEGGAAIRFIIGRFGSGKTFFLNLARTVALERRFVVLQADITPDRRLHGSSGQARALYSEMMRNLATRAKPEGGALRNLIERWIGQVHYDVQGGGGTDEDVGNEIERQIRPLQEMVSGFDFITVVRRYYEGYLNQDDQLQEAALRWLRAEHKTKTEAREALGVRSIIDDASMYDYLKLFAAFVRIAGFSGLMVNIDELVVLSHRLNSSQARNNNYETILRIVNDCLQGQAEGVKFMFAGTDEALQDRRRGLYSYEALATRLAPSRFVTEGVKDLSSPVIELENLTPEDCFVLLQNIRDVHAGYDPEQRLVPDDGIEAYLKQCHDRLGATCFQTPRDTIRDFVGMLNVIEQNPGIDWQTLVGDYAGASAKQAEQENRTASKPNAETNDDDLTEFTL
jgi:hypothetical protein